MPNTSISEPMPKFHRRAVLGGIAAAAAASVSGAAASDKSGNLLNELVRKARAARVKLNAADDRFNQLIAANPIRDPFVEIPLKSMRVRCHQHDQIDQHFDINDKFLVGRHKAQNEIERAELHSKLDKAKAKFKAEWQACGLAEVELLTDQIMEEEDELTGQIVNYVPTSVEEYRLRNQYFADRIKDGWAFPDAELLRILV